MKRALIVALLILGSYGPSADAAHSGAQVPGCFPVSLWSAAPWTRPCNRVSTLEDGSGRLTLGTASRVEHVCRIPARPDRRKRFVIVCQKNISTKYTQGR